MIRIAALGLLVAAYIVTCFLSPYGFWMKDSPQVETVADLPDAAIPGDIRWRFDKGLQVRVNRPDLPLAASRAKLGWAYRNFEALKLPFYPYAGEGWVLYSESRNYLQMIPLDDAAVANLNAVAGRDLTAGFTFQSWRYWWGWIFAVLFAVWLIFQFRHEAVVRKRERERELAGEEE